MLAVTPCRTNGQGGDAPRHHRVARSLSMEDRRRTQRRPIHRFARAWRHGRRQAHCRELTLSFEPLHGCAVEYASYNAPFRSQPRLQEPVPPPHGIVGAATRSTSHIAPFISVWHRLPPASLRYPRGALLEARPLRRFEDKAIESWVKMTERIHPLQLPDASRADCYLVSISSRKGSGAQIPDLGFRTGAKLRISAGAGSGDRTRDRRFGRPRLCR
jgi:hypothetical protein